MVPRARSFQCGAYSPEKAGTKYTPPLSSASPASFSTSLLLAIIPKLSRSHCTSAPVTAIDPSKA